MSLAKPPKLVGAGGNGRQEPRQDEGPQSLGGLERAPSAAEKP